MRDIVVEELQNIPVSQQRIEIVERKGIGHPDTICDSICDSISVALSQEYLKKLGVILHHNIDKALLAAGQSEVKFGGGKVTEPMLLVIGDRATFFAQEESIPVNEITTNTAKKWIKDNLRFVDPEKHIKYQSVLKQGSAELTDIFKRKDQILGANDTSAAVGYAPMTSTEKTILETETFLNSKDFKKNFKEVGEDIKIMGMRTGNNLNLTIAIAFIDKFIDSEDFYFKRKEEVIEELKNFLAKNDFSNGFEKIDVNINTLDRKGRGISGVYLTVTGTSAESADCGEVGRGNRVNGVIALNRPVFSEAAAGKNPVSHVGKIYNALTYRIADEIYKQVPGLKEVYVWLVSQIGRPINDPAMAAAQVILEDGNKIGSLRNEIQEVVDKELENIQNFCMDLAKGKIRVC